MPELICDFCSAPHPTWTFRAGRSLTLFPDPGKTFADPNTENPVVVEDTGDGWAACDICAGAICRNDRAALLGRSVRMFYETHPDMRHIPQAAITQLVTIQHDNFFATKLDNGRKGVHNVSH